MSRVYHLPPLPSPQNIKGPFPSMVPHAQIAPTHPVLLLTYSGVDILHISSSNERTPYSFPPFLRSNFLRRDRRRRATSGSIWGSHPTKRRMSKRRKWRGRSLRRCNTLTNIETSQKHLFRGGGRRDVVCNTSVV